MEQALLPLPVDPLYVVRRISTGALVPAFSLTMHDGQPFTLARVIGKPWVLIFYLHDSMQCTAELKEFADLFHEFSALGVEVIAVGGNSAQSAAALSDQWKLPFPLLADVEGQIFALFEAVRPTVVGNLVGNELRRRTITFGPDARVVAIYDEIRAETHAANVLVDIRRLLFAEPPRLIERHAPVLILKNVLPPPVCRRLIEIWESQGNSDSGFMKQSNGQTVGITDHRHKIRRDHFLKGGADEDLVKQYVADRVLPEIKQAFNYAVTRREDFRIACYDAQMGGYFRPHRDNTTDATAHRRFAMSLLLNDDYEGGCLRFPEFAPHLYRPAAGSAAIFSCSLLHEATDVTAGRRFVLLSFFYGDAEARIREDYNRRVGGTYRA